MTDEAPKKSNAVWAAYAMNAIGAGGIETIVAMLVKNLPGLGSQEPVDGVSAEGRLYHKGLPDMALHVEIRLTFIDVDPDEDHGPTVALDEEGPMFLDRKQTAH